MRRYRHRRNPLLTNTIKCPHCLGRGMVYSGVCSFCDGYGRTDRRSWIRHNPCVGCVLAMAMLRKKRNPRSLRRLRNPSKHCRKSRRGGGMCGELMAKDCLGELRCPFCDGVCPSCGAKMWADCYFPTPEEQARYDAEFERLLQETDED